MPWWRYVANPGLGRIVKRKAYDLRRQPFLFTIKFTDLDLGTDFRMLNLDSAQRHVFAQDRGAHRAGNFPNLVATNIDAVAVSRQFIAVQLEADEHSLWIFLALD